MISLSLYIIIIIYIYISVVGKDNFSWFRTYIHHQGQLLEIQTLNMCHT